MTYETLLLPRLPAGLLGPLNRLYGGSRSLAFSAAGHEWRFAPDGSAKPVVWRARIYLRLGDYDAAVFLDSTLLADWEGSGLSAPALSALPPELAGAALEVVCAELIEAFEEASGLVASVTGVNMDEEEAWLPDEGLAFSLTREDGQTVRGAVAAALPCLEILADLFDRAPPGDGPDVAAWKLPCRILLSGPDFSAAELMDLEAGDVLLTGLPARDADVGLPVRLAANEHCAAPARLEGALLHLEGVMTEDTAPLDEENLEGADEGDAGAPEGAAPLNAVSAADLPLRVHFDLGGLEMTVAEAAALAPGQVLATGRDAAKPVRIVAGGQIIGSGSLVDVAGSLGVRIETLTLK